MKPLLPILLFVLTTHLEAPAEDASAAGAVGRFQLVPATVMISLQPTPTLFRIDSATGETWVYHHASFPVPPSMSSTTTTTTITVEGWAPIGSYPAAFSNYLAMYRQPKPTK